MVENRPFIETNAGIDESVSDVTDSLASPSSSNNDSDSVLENVATTTLNHVTMVHSTPSIESLPQKMKKNKLRGSTTYAAFATKTQSCPEKEHSIAKRRACGNGAC